MNRLLPVPWLTFALLLTWLALTELSAAHVLLAVLLGIAIPLVCAPLIAGLPSLHAPVRACRLIAIVAWDIVVANVVVARLVLGRVRRLQPAFFEVPVALSQPYAVTLLATIITMTPGTVSVEISPDGKVLRVHALDMTDEPETIALIKRRYEAPLAEILQC